VVGERAYLLIYPAVYGAALIGGLWVGALATTMAMLGAWYLVVPPVPSWEIKDLRDAFGLVVFWLAGIAFSIFGARFKFALEQARLAHKQAEIAGEQLKAANERLERAIEKNLGRPSDLQDILLDIVDTAIEIAGADFGNVQLIDPETQTL